MSARRAVRLVYPGALLFVLTAALAGFAHGSGAEDEALVEGGTVWAWGCNWRGQWGDGTTEDRHEPFQIQGLTGVRAVYPRLAIKADGRAWTWRDPDGTEDPRRIVGVPGSDGITTMGQSFARVGMKSDGTVWEWQNYRPYSSILALFDSPCYWRAPVPVEGLSDVVAVASGGRHDLAVKADGTVWGWGDNEHWQIGGDRTPSLVLGSMNSLYGKRILDYRVHEPRQVAGLAEIVAVAGGTFQSIALRRDGTVWRWGGYDAEPAQAEGLTKVKAIATGYYHLLALREDDTVWWWGWSPHWKRRGCDIPDRPTRVEGLTDVKAIAGGQFHSLALRGDGTVWAWGRNNCGQLGDGTTEDRVAPIQVKGLTGVIAISAGFDHSLAVKE